MLQTASAIRVALRRSGPALSSSVCRPQFFSSSGSSALSLSASQLRRQQPPPALLLLLRSLGAAASRPPRGCAAFTTGRQLLQRAADVSPLSSSGSSGSAPAAAASSSPASGRSSASSSPFGRWERWGNDNESVDERQLRLLRHLWLLSFVILTFSLLNWWNSSVAAGGALLTAHEVKELFERLMQLLQKEDAMLRAELGVLSELSKRGRDDVRNELQDIRREIVAVLLNAREGRRGGASRGEPGWGGDYWGGDGRGSSIRERLSSAVSGGGWGDREREQREQGEQRDGGDSWLSSLAEKASEKAREAAEKAGQLTSRWRGDDQSAWEQGFTSGLHAQLVRDPSYGQQQQQQLEAAKAASRATAGSERFKGGGTVPTSQIDAAYQTGKNATDKPQQQ